MEVIVIALVSLNCPNCGGSLKMEDTMEKGLCMYCGSAFLVKDEIQRVQVEHSGTVNLNLNRKTEINNLLTRAEQNIAEYRDLSSNVTVEHVTMLLYPSRDPRVMILDPNRNRKLSMVLSRAIVLSVR